MNYSHLHPWQVSLKDAFGIQGMLKEKIILTQGIKKINIVSAVDVVYAERTATAAVVTLDYPVLNLIETSRATQKVKFPYVPGLLTFREDPVILSALKRIRIFTRFNHFR